MTINRKILIVEDDVRLCRSLESLLVQAGWGVGTAGCLAEARGRLGAGVPDCILLDLTLPDGDGVCFLEELRGRDLHTRVVISTGATGLVRLAAVEELEPAALLLKPYGIDRLLQACDNVLRGMEGQGVGAVPATESLSANSSW